MSWGGRGPEGLASVTSCQRATQKLSVPTHRPVVIRGPSLPALLSEAATRLAFLWILFPVSLSHLGSGLRLHVDLGPSRSPGGLPTWPGARAPRPGSG